MDRIYLVQGSSGEYSDWREWPVRAFETQAEADACVKACEEAARTRPTRPQHAYPTTAANRDAWQLAHAQWAPKVRAHIAASPDDSMPENDAVDYSVAEVPFGMASTALCTVPPRVRPSGRQFDLVED